MSLLDEVKRTNFQASMSQVNDEVLESFPEVNEALLAWIRHKGSSRASELFDTFMQQAIGENCADIAIASLRAFSASVTFIRNILEDCNEDEELQTENS